MQVCKKVDKRIEEVFEETIEKWIEKVEQVCEDLPWPLDWFCRAVTTLVKIVEVVVKTVVRFVTQVICYPVAFLLTLAGLIVQLLLLIPFIGPIVKWLIGAVVWVWSQFVGLLDAAAGLIGLRPIKHLRLEVIILMRPGRTLTVAPAATGPLLAQTETIFRTRADVKVHTTLHQVNTPSPEGALTIGTEIDPFFGLLGEDLTEAGLYFQTTITEKLWQDNPWFAIRVGAPIVVFVVEEVQGSYAGCAAGPVIDYICVEGRTFAGSDMTLIAHEMGHALGLLHDKVTDCDSGDVTNLMYCKSGRSGQSRGSNLSPFQRAVVRSSPHVTYL